MTFKSTSYDWKATGAVAYDNEVGTADAAEASTVIAGGSIVIQRGD